MAATKTIKIDIDVVNKDFKSVQTELKELAKLIGNLSKAGISETPKAFKDMMEASSSLQTKIGTLSTTIDNALKNKRLGKDLRDSLKEVNRELDSLEQRARTITGKSFSPVLTPKKEMVSPILEADKKQKKLNREALKAENKRANQEWIDDGIWAGNLWANQQKRNATTVENDRKAKAAQTKANTRQELQEIVNLYKDAYGDIRRLTKAQTGKQPGYGMGWEAIKEEIGTTRANLKVQKAGIKKGADNKDLVQSLTYYDAQLAAQEKFVNAQLALEKKQIQDEAVLQKERLVAQQRWNAERQRLDLERLKQLGINLKKEDLIKRQSGMGKDPFYTLRGMPTADKTKDWQAGRKQYQDLESSEFVKTKANSILFNQDKVKELTARLSDLKAASGDVAKQKLFAQPNWFPGLELDKKGINSLAKGIKNALTVELKSAEIASNGLRTGLGRALNAIRTSIFELGKFQARWYLTKFALFEPLRLGGAAITGAFEFTKMLDMWEAKLLRWEATSGKVSGAVRSDMAEIIKSARELALQYPVTVDEILKTTEGFVSAGMPSDIVKKLVPTITKLKTSFPEINMEQFAPAIVGAWNAWKTTIGDTADEAQKFTIILEKLLYAQAKGVIKPENFTVLLQHLSEMGRVSGLTLDQLLALSVGVTDLGSKTGSAARSLRQFLQQLQNTKNMDKVAKWMKEVGVTINTKQPLGGQLFKIIEGFQKLVGARSPRSMEAMSWLRQIFPLETLKSASSIIDYFEKIKDLAEKGLPNAMGGLDASSKLMLDRLGSRVILLQNQMKELSISIGKGLAFKELFTMLNDMAFGALLAFGNEAAKAVTSVEKLGNAGYTTYLAMGALKTVIDSVVLVFQGIGTSFSWIKNGLEDITGTALDTKTAIEALFLVIGSYMAGSLITWAIKMVTHLGIMKVAILAVGRAIESIKVLGLVDGLKYAALTASSLITPWGAIQAAITVTIGVVTLLYYEFKKSREELDKMIKGMTKLPQWMKEQKLERMKDVLKRSAPGYEGPNKATSAEIKDTFGASSNFESLESKRPDSILSLLGNKLSQIGFRKVLEDKVREAEYETTQPKEPTETEMADAEKSLERQQGAAKIIPEGDKGPPKTGGKGGAKQGQEFTLEKKDFQERIKLRKDFEAEALAITETAHNLNEIGDIDYYNEKFKIQKASLEDQIALAEKFFSAVTGGKVKEQLAIDLANISEKELSGKDVIGDRERLEKKWGLEGLEAYRNLIDKKTELGKVELKNYEEVELAKRKIAKETLDLEIALQQIKREEVYQTKQSELDRAQKQSDYLYERFDISAKEAARNEIATAERTRDLKIQNNRDSLNDKLDVLALEAQAAGGNEELLKNIALRVQAAFATQRKEDSASTQEWLNKVQDMYQKFAQNIKLIFEESGIGGVISKVAEDMSKVWGNMAENIKSSFETVMNTLETELEGIFDNLMDGVIDWKKAVENVLKTMAKEIIKTTAIKPFMSGLTGKISEMTKPKEGEQPGWWSKIFGATGKEGKGTAQELTAQNTKDTVDVLNRIESKMDGGLGGGGKEKSPFSLPGTEGSTPVRDEATEVLGETTESFKRVNQELVKTPSCFEQFFTGIKDLFSKLFEFVKGLMGGMGGSEFGGENMSWMGGWDSSAWSMPDFAGSFAKGGKIGLNKLALIGEEGPELFKPSTSGTIIPNGMFGGQPTVNSTVNVINQTKTPVNAKQSEVKFNGKEYIVNVVLDEITNNYGPLRHAVRGVK